MTIDDNKEEKHPRFGYCEEIKCPDCYNCKEKLEVRAARDIGAIYESLHDAAKDTNSVFRKYIKSLPRTEKNKQRT